jgi:hypothetical protein
MNRSASIFSVAFINGYLFICSVQPGNAHRVVQNRSQLSCEEKAQEQECTHSEICTLLILY